ncbi:MAG TPA: hypothetical protein VHX44_17745 [Planctomycetota bacterium]|nr:hypothetical protein [Planctomycetota bacterium]
MKSPAEDIDQRRTVWEALSELYLDTDTSLTRASRAKVLASSSYSLAELEKILANEVHPVCFPNQFQIAGEWVGFDLEWLEKGILKRQSSAFRWFNWFWVFNINSSEWRRTKSAVAAFRESPRKEV